MDAKQIVINQRSQSVKELHPAHEARLINYLKATGIEIGLLINFGNRVEIKRKVLTPLLVDDSPQKIGSQFFERQRN